MVMKKGKNAYPKKSGRSTGESELKSSLQFTKTTTDHVAVFTIDMLGSIKFLTGYILLFTVWICWNLNFIPGLKPFDPFPFPILEMVVSLFAIVLSVSVLINQNRQSRIEKIKQQVDFEINVRAEEEITRVLNMVHEIHQKLGLKTSSDDELEAMKESTDITKIHQTVDEKDKDESNP
jgi:uncharacterized membrane protein